MKVQLTFEVDDDFEIGLCKKCPFYGRNDFCVIEDALTDGACRLNCFCRLKIVKQ